ncbi:MAG: hypothetical protein ACRDM1_07390 [Gaiellaceae bacterium]
MRFRPSAGPVAGRGLVLLPAGALLVHELRYRLTYGSQTGSELANQGHAYLGSLVPWVVMLAAGGFACFLARVARASRAHDGEGRGRPFLRLWATTAAGLVAIYAMQELLEGVIYQGHPAGFAGIFGHGGWWAVPSAVAVSLVIVLLLRSARTIVRLAARTRRAPRRRAVIRVVHFPEPLLLTAAAPLAAAAAGRAPPLLLAG